MILETLQWYVAIQLVGVAGLPLTLRLFRSLPDRGWAFARPLSLFLVGYVLWLGSVLGFLGNRPLTSAVVVAVLGAAAWFLLADPARDLARLWRERRSAVVASEALFLAAFLGWAIYRSFVPEIANTEKPMEFAFLNSILRSSSFPPPDPWLAGYSISYYYFGYLLTAVLVQLSAISAGVGFNLMIATLFALTATGAFSIVHNLVAGVAERAPRGDRVTRSAADPVTYGFLGAVFVVVLANWEALLELLHARGLGSDTFWAAVGINDLDRPFQSPTWYPAESVSPWWWFRASRVIGTYAPDGKAVDYTINEFPFFSFLLGDLHPHVLALPFTLLALSFALVVVREIGASWGWLEKPIGPGWLRDTRLPRWIATYLYLYPREALRREPTFVLLAWVVFGGLSFLNAWDLPTYLFVLVGAFALRRYLDRPRLDRALVREALTFGWIVLLGGALLYLPFYIGFRSQTAGIGLVPIRSQIHHFLIFWGPLLVVVASFLVVQLRRATLPGREDVEVRPPRRDALAGVWLPALAFAALVLVLQIPPIAAALPQTIQAPALAVLVPLLAAAGTLLWRYLGEIGVGDEREVKRGTRRPATVAGGTVAASLAPEHAFVLFLSFTGLLLILGTELVFVRDFFGNRMNTVFKLYYQAWTLLAVVAAYGVYYLLGRIPRRGAGRVGAGVWAVVCASAILVGLIYAPASMTSRTGAAGDALTLDGTEYLAAASPEDYAAIRWLQENVDGQPTILEATGGSYSQAGRVSANTGLPTLLGWEFHEQQWRGTFEEASRRKGVVDQIYQTQDREEALRLLTQMGVTYVYVGPLEVQTYGRQDSTSLSKFAEFMDVAYDDGGVVIYSLKR